MSLTIIYLLFIFIGASGFALILMSIACLVAGLMYLSAFFLNLRDELLLARMNRRAARSQAR